MEITTDNGHTVLIDPEDWPRVRPYRWRAYNFNGIWYATTTIAATTVYMHRLVMDSPDDREVDHRNGNGLDNRRGTNLRLATHAQNLANQRLSARNTSGYRGVSFAKRRATYARPWEAQIKHLGKKIGLGYFKTAE